MSKPITGSTLEMEPAAQLPDDPREKLLARVEGLTPNQCAIVLKLIGSMDRLAKSARRNN